MKKDVKVLSLIIFILKITLVGFGGGNALMPVIRNECVIRNKWLTEKEFEKIVIVTNMLPGASVIQVLGYISVKLFGKLKGFFITLIVILPHVLIAFGLFLLSNYLPTNYLFVIAIGVLSSIVGVLFAFGWNYMKTSKDKIRLPVWLFLFVFTFSFCFFVPTPYNLPIIVMIVVFIILGFIEFITYRKTKKKIFKKDNK